MEVAEFDGWVRFQIQIPNEVTRRARKTAGSKEHSPPVRDDLRTKTASLEILLDDNGDGKKPDEMPIPKLHGSVVQREDYGGPIRGTSAEKSQRRDKLAEESVE